jgi:hypothetical protein
MKKTYIVIWLDLKTMAFKLSVGGQTISNDFKNLDEVAFAIEKLTTQ